MSEARGYAGRDLTRICALVFRQRPLRPHEACLRQRLGRILCLAEGAGRPWLHKAAVQAFRAGLERRQLAASTSNVCFDHHPETGAGSR
jgi:hypothetical protein